MSVNFSLRNIHEIEGFILAGGASSRMGRDKTELLLGGKTFVEHAVFSMQIITPQNVYIVGNGEKESIGLPVLPDATDKNARGAIIGLYAALVHTKAEWTAVLACDLPFVTSELFEKLILLATEDFDAVKSEKVFIRVFAPEATAANLFPPARSSTRCDRRSRIHCI